MNEFQMTPASAFTSTGALTAERTTSFLRKVYGWMAIGMGVSAATALAIAASPNALQTIATSRPLFWGLWIAPFAVAMYLQVRIEKIQPATASLLFVVYSALIGAWLSPILLIYTGVSIATTFLVSGGAFAAMAIFGTVTRRSLAGFGHFIWMGFIGLFFAMLVSVFWKAAAQSAGLQFAITVIGVIVFTGMAAWKAQQMKQLAAVIPEEKYGSYSVVGALQLYITFINLFLIALRIFGGRRN
jgi:FtsH-binding integral membrane protein